MRNLLAEHLDEAATRRTVAAITERGGDTNGPAAVYSIEKYLEWMKK